SLTHPTGVTYAQATEKRTTKVRRTRREESLKGILRKSYNCVTPLQFWQNLLPLFQFITDVAK
ncbi:hypothetical protein PN486_04410, partial [Nodularia spumigena CS-587/03]|nr:hypothetical protein [Nodularia spumigena CS-587/03]